jgi:hypothetical protein
MFEAETMMSKAQTQKQGTNSGELDGQEPEKGIVSSGRGVLVSPKARRDKESFEAAPSSLGRDLG